jgi:hypothetical protein
MGLPFVVNYYVRLPLGHRFLLLAIFYLQVAVVWLLLRFTPGARAAGARLAQGPARWAAIAAITAILAGFGFLNVDRALARFDSGPSDSKIVRYARRAAEIAGSNAVVLGSERDVWPLSAFGPRVVSLYHENPLVENRLERGRAADVFFSARGGEAQRWRVIDEFKVTHVLASRVRSRRARRFLADHAEKHTLPAGYELYAIRR